MSSKKKIALFVSSLGFGGAERVVSRLANELIKHYHVTIVLLYGKVELSIDKEVTIVVLSKKGETFKNSSILKAFDIVKFMYKYQKLVKKEKFDVSISFLARQNIINSISKILHPKVKTMISERCFPSLMYKSNTLKLALRKLILSYFYNKNNLLFSNSIYINQDLKENFNLKIKTDVVYNPVVIEDNTRTIDNNTPIGDNFNIITVGRLSPVKNHKGIIEAMALLTGNYKLNLYGVGELEKSLKTLTLNLELTNKVFFNGIASNINEHLIKNQCLVLFSNTEGFPNALLEAMSVGLPVISSNCMSGPLELINNNQPVTIAQGTFYKAKFGLLVNVNDIVGLSKAITYLKTNPKERVRYTNLGIERSKNYNIVNIGLQIKALIDNLE